MQDDSQNFFSVELMMKATPREEGGERVIYCEASNETVDAQNEVVLQKALADSMEYMLAKGNFDIDHITMVGAQKGIPDYMLYEIGRPTEIRFRDGKTFVKGVIIKGEGKAAERANYFWSSLTEISPPARWYPSVGGSILARDVSIDEKTGSQVVKVSRVRWTNIGYTKNPVNQTVPAIQTIPLETFAKCFTPGGGFNLAKALEAGYGTDGATLTDGAALRTQSIDKQIQTTLPRPASYAEARDMMAERIHPNSLAGFLRKCGVDEAEAHEWSRQFTRDVFTNRRSYS